MTSNLSSAVIFGSAILNGHRIQAGSLPKPSSYYFGDFLSRSTRTLAILASLLFLSVDLAKCEIPPVTRALFPFQDTHVAQACQAALLLTPEQTTEVQGIWERSWREILLIEKSNSESKRQELFEVKKRLEQERDAILTPEQRDIMQNICDIWMSVYKEISMEYKAQIDAAFSGDEKNRLVGEMSKAVSEAAVAEIQKSLSGDRLEMFRAVLDKNVASQPKTR